MFSNSICTKLHSSKCFYKSTATKWLNMTTNNIADVNLCLPAELLPIQAACVVDAIEPSVLSVSPDLTVLRLLVPSITQHHFDISASQAHKSRQKLFEDFLNAVGCADFFVPSEPLHDANWSLVQKHMSLSITDRHAYVPWSRSKKRSEQREPFLNIN